MIKPTQISLCLILAGILVFSGCASSRTQKDINVLKAQVGAITEELVRMDQSLQATRTAVQAEQNRNNEFQTQTGTIRAASQSAVYRTPSGFELLALDIQQALKNAGYYQGSLDGKIGSGTQGAIKAFQRDQGLTVDGVVGRQTWGKLKVYLQVIK